MSAPLSAKIPPEALPASDAGVFDWLRLTRSQRVGPATFIRLIREHGSAEAALAALPGIAEAAGVRGYAPAPRSGIEAELGAAEAAGARALLLGAAGYPALLATIPDPPPLLWSIGEPALGGRPAVALVGARNASALGCRMAARLARDLGAGGLVVASGLARGIDASAHEAALPTGTIAVFAGGVDVIYPAENAGIAERIAAEGLLLSETPMGHAPRPQDFPRRNRIVSGLALGVVVIEGAERSGSLITARDALDQGREVMAVPGNPLDPRAGGCNLLIREGATLVRSAADVAETLGASLAEFRSAPRAPEPPFVRNPEARFPARPDPARPQDAAPQGPLADRLLGLLGPTPSPEDLLIRATGAAPGDIAALLLELELDGRVLRHPGGAYSAPPRLTTPPRRPGAQAAGPERPDGRG